MAEKVKSIQFRMNLEGRGIVNFDTQDQGNYFPPTHRLYGGRHNNNSYAKKAFLNKEMDYNIVISSACLNRALNTDEIAISPKIMHTPMALYSKIASPSALLGGYMFPKDNEIIKRKGLFTIVDAEQTNEAISHLPGSARTGQKIQEKADTGKSDTSLFNKENIGNVVYFTSGVFDLKELRFVSCSQFFDRCAFNSDLFPEYKKFLSKRLPSFNSELGYYRLANSTDITSELGFMLSDLDIVNIVKEQIIKMMNLHIRRRDAYAQVQSLQIRLNTNITKSIHNKRDGWLNVTIDDNGTIMIGDLKIDDFYFETFDGFYEQVDPREAEKLNEIYEGNFRLSQNNKREAHNLKKELDLKKKELSNSKTKE